MSPSRATKARYGRSSIRRSSAAPRRIRWTARSVLSGAAPRPGKCLPVAATPWRSHRGGERDRGPDHAARPASEAPALGADRAAGPTDVEHRRQVDVDSRPASGCAPCERPGGGCSRRLGGPSPAPRRPAPRRAASRARPPGRSSPAGDRAGPGPVDRLKPADQPAGVIAAAEVVGEQDHAGEPPLADHPLDLRAADAGPRSRRPAARPRAVARSDRRRRSRPLGSPWSRRRAPPRCPLRPRRR